VDVVNLNDARRELLSTLQLVPTGWNVVDEAVPGMEIHPPCALLLYGMQVSSNVMGGRAATFTVKLVVDPATEAQQYDQLLDAIGDGGLVDEIVTALDAPSSVWSSAIVDTDITVTDELAGQIVAPYAEVRIEVWS
jgi:hypothetical protein